MNYLDILKIIPGVAGPVKRLTFRDKLKWTLLILLLFYVLSQILVWGIDPEAVQRFALLETLLGSTMGSIITLGIGPIVTASIILQLLVGSKIIKWDTGTEEGRIMFMGTQKLLAIAFTIFEAAAFVIFGAIPPASAEIFIVMAVIAQIAAGGFLIILMDEVVSKWGFGSGISLFIAAGVSKEIFIGAISPLTAAGGLPGAGEFSTGKIPAAIQSIAAGDPVSTIALLIPVFFTIVIFFFIVFAQAIRIEIPLAFGRLRGFGRRWPLRLFYTSVIPVILSAALLANFQMWAGMLATKGITFFGTFDAEGNPVSGLAYYIIPPREASLADIVVAALTGVSIPPVAISWITYTIFMIACCILFSVFWVNTAGMDSKTVARQIQRVGLVIPGFRRDVRIIERVLDRYIPYLAVIGGAAVGLLAAFADFTGALGTGTGILLTVMIVFNLYEEISRQHLEDMHPALRRFMG